MSSSKRKDRRQKELIQRGRRADEIRTEALQNQAATKKRLTTVQEHEAELEIAVKKMVDRDEEHLRELGELHVTLNGQGERIDTLQKELAIVQAAWEQREATVTALKANLILARNELKELKSADHDAKKLRRRLMKAKEDLAQKTTALHRATRVDVF